MLLVAGSLNYDTTLIVNHFAPPKSIVRKIMRYFGGSGGNAAVAAAKILGKGKVFMLGALGDDEIGLKYLEELKKVGVDTSLIKVFKNVETGQAFIALRPDGENAVYSFRGANDLLMPDVLTEEDLALIRCMNALLLMNPPLPTAKLLVDMFRNMKKPIFWDPGALSKKGFDELLPIIKFCDYILPNEDELLFMTNTSNVNDALRRLFSVNPKVKLVIKVGIRGSVFIDPTKKLVIEIPAVRPELLGLRVTSTVGCGDTFTAVFTSFKLLGRDDLEALKIATCAASIKASRENPQGSPTLNELLSYLSRCYDYIAERVSGLRI